VSVKESNSLRENIQISCERPAKRAHLEISRRGVRFSDSASSLRVDIDIQLREKKESFANAYVSMLGICMRDLLMRSGRLKSTVLLLAKNAVQFA
jgi:hypothetical protein